MSRAPGSPSTARTLAEAYGLRPFRFRDAVAAGRATERTLRSCVGARQVVRVRPGVAATRLALETLVPDARRYHLLQVHATLLALDRPGWASLESAAYIHDLPRRLGAAPARAVHIDVPGLPDVVLDPLDAVDLPAFVPVHLHGSRVPEEQRTVVDRVAVTSLERTAVELARGRPLHLALVPVDAAIRRLVLEGPVAHGPGSRRYLAANPAAVELARARLSRVTDLMRGWPGVVAAREAVARADPRAESPLESSSRGHMLARNLPCPDVGAAVIGDDGRTYYGDLVWRAERVIGESDGWSKYALGGDPMQRLREEKRREDALRRAGWVIVRWTSDELRTDPAAVVLRIARALAEGRRTR